MRTFFSKNLSILIFASATGILFLIMMLVEQAQHRFWLNDFKVFYWAAKALIQGEQVYGVAFGLETGFYKYSPVTLLFFTPYTLLPYSTASVIHFWIIVSATIGLVVLLNSLVSQYLTESKGIPLLTYLVGLVCILNHLIRELHLGNTNIILLLLLTQAAHSTLHRKSLLAGVLLAIAILTKPYFLILGLPFLILWDWKTMTTTVASLLIFIGSSLLIFGLDRGLELYTLWIESMSQHSGYLSSNHTISSLIETYLSISLPGYAGYILFAVSSLTLCFYFFRSKMQREKAFLLFFFMLIALVPNFLVTDTEHFLFALPLILFMIKTLVEKQNFLGMLLFGVVIAGYAGNSSDLLGNELSNRVDQLGILGISNLIVISAVFYYSAAKSKISS
ncbi:MAG: hypothetical protein CL840_12925 [Crocinitomicaceae bacterium]|nr:hypothetical protein [Crocinitomicaceae bacterium]|tara:strand:- start:1156 stop:2328 length:1173 start_codon:yes stop_codon:yes gene_type:complete